MSKPFDFNNLSNNSVAQIKAEANRRGLQIPARLNKNEMVTWLANAIEGSGAPASPKQTSPSQIPPSPQRQPTPQKQLSPQRPLSPVAPKTPSGSARSSRTPTPVRSQPCEMSCIVSRAFLALLFILFCLAVEFPVLGPVFCGVLALYGFLCYRQRKC